KNEWIVWCDSDDALLPIYLKMFAKAIGLNLGVSLFTCGAAVYNERNMTYHERPAVTVNEKEQFKSGKIGSGSFIFKRDMAYVLPDSERPYGDAESFSAKVQKENPGIYKLYGQNGAGEYLPLGNPWGDDYVMFYLLTRTDRPKMIEMPLYIQFVR
ncbi:MAG: hypothetical protein JRL30_28700, partial [Deltaproteobacteria bacterium]|nr:hypothetical protein [Deltaproteobacteria bacterium]